MDTEKQALLVRATKGLKLRDIALFSAKFERPSTDSGESSGAIFQQHKRGVTYAQGEAGADNDNPVRLLQVHVLLGTRVVREAEAGEPVPLFVIEADYLVEYEMTDDVPDEAVNAFAEFNAIHNVWPFWRQHVFGVVDRGRLPRLEVPLFEGVVL